MNSNDTFKLARLIDGLTSELIRNADHLDLSVIHLTEIREQANTIARQSAEDAAISQRPVAMPATLKQETEMKNWLAPEFVGVVGPVNGLGDRHPHGSYVALTIVSKDGAQQRWLIPRGAAEGLAVDIEGLLRAAQPEVMPEELMQSN